MNTNRLASFGLLSFILFGFSTGCGDDAETQTQQPPPELSEELRADLQATLDAAVADGATPGAVIHVSSAEGTWSGAAGVADISGAVPMKSGDRFRAGSIMKTLVATAVLQNVEGGALDLGDVLTDHLPAEVTGRIEHADAIDVEMLLGHRSGIPDWVTDYVTQTVVTDPAHVWSLDEILSQVDEQPPAFEPGETYGYSNTNFVLLGEILSVVEGRTWREVVRERVIAPAGMVDTTLPDPGDVECSGCAHGYIAMDGEMLDATNVDPSMAGASGGHALVTTAADLARLLEQLRAGALFESPDTRDAMFAFQPAVDGGESGGYLTGYGLGVLRLEMDGEIIVGHLGGTAGYVGSMLYVASTGRYVSGFMNVMGDPGVVLVPALTRLAKP